MPGFHKNSQSHTKCFVTSTCLHDLSQEGIFHMDVLKGHVAKCVQAFSKNNQCQQLTEQMSHLIRILKCLSLDPTKVKYTKLSEQKSMENLLRVAFIQG